MAAEGTIRAFWRGNGTNVTKNIPEMVRCCVLACMLWHKLALHLESMTHLLLCSLPLCWRLPVLLNSPTACCRA